MNEEISVPRFPILGFRIPNSVWRMGILEYRTMRLRGRGAHGRAGAGSAGTGDGGGADTGCTIPIAGGDMRCPMGYLVI